MAGKTIGSQASSLEIERNHQPGQYFPNARFDTAKVAEVDERKRIRYPENRYIPRLSPQNRGLDRYQLVEKDIKLIGNRQPRTDCARSGSSCLGSRNSAMELRG